MLTLLRFSFFFFNDTAPTEIYAVSQHAALPILALRRPRDGVRHLAAGGRREPARPCARGRGGRSEEHTSELQSQSNLVCRLLLEKKKRAAAARRRGGRQ